VNFPNRHPLYCGMYPVSKDFEKTTGLKPDLLFLVGCQGVHGAVTEPSVMQIGPNPVLMGRHYPLDLAAQCDVKATLQAVIEALTRLHGAETVSRWSKRRQKVSAYAKTLIEREEKLAREHEGDAVIHPPSSRPTWRTCCPARRSWCRSPRRRARRCCRSATVG